MAQGIFEALKVSLDFTQLEEKMHSLLQGGGGVLLVHVLKEIDRQLLSRKEEGLRVVGSRERALLTKVGEIKIKRRLYVDKTGHYTFLLDQSLGLRLGAAQTAQ